LAPRGDAEGSDETFMVGMTGFATSDATGAGSALSTVGGGMVIADRKAARADVKGPFDSPPVAAGERGPALVDPAHVDIKRTVRVTSKIPTPPAAAMAQTGIRGRNAGIVEAVNRLPGIEISRSLLIGAGAAP
jgi:hypothetical protein